MKKITKITMLLIVIILLSSCGKKSYVIFDYNCNGQEYHKCELKNNKLNCKVETPTCREYKFKGWYKANEYKNQVDLNGTFNKNEIIYARWEENGQLIESSSQELVSTIITPTPIDQPSSSQIEYSSQEEPSSQQPIPEATYTILFNANGGSGGQSSPINGVKYGANLPSINQTKPTKSGYTFLGWYDSQTGGTQYYNSSNSPVKKYDKKSNITLYAQWRINVLTIQYNGNGGTWISTSSTYGVNSSGTVIVKSTGQAYSQKVNYGNSLESSGLVDHNGSWFKWKKDGYTVESKKEYIIGTTVIDQSKVYSATDLARYSGCDLSKSDCTITVKVNWKKVDYLPEVEPVSGGKIVYSKKTDTLKVTIQRKKDKDSSYYYLTYIWVADAYKQSSKAQAKNYPNERQQTKSMLEDEIKREGLQNKLVIATNASAYYNSSYAQCQRDWKRANDEAGYAICGEGVSSCSCYPAKTNSEEYSKKYVNTQAGNLVITKGQVVRNWPSQDAVDKSHDLDLYGIDPSGTFRVFRNINGGNESSRKALYQQIINTGIKDTIVWYVPIILDGKTVGWKNNQNKNNITAFCQINKNNFVIFSCRSAVYNHLVPDTFEELGCQNAVNFDGGGSVEILYKDPNGSVTRIFDSWDDRANAEIFYFTE